MTHHTTTHDIHNGEGKTNTEQVMEAAREKTEAVVQETKTVAKQAGQEVKSTLDVQKSEAAGQLHGLAQAIRQTSSQLREQNQGAFANYSHQVANQIDNVSAYLQERDMNDLIVETENFARRQPELFIGGAFTLGLLVARFLKSSNPEQNGRVYNPPAKVNYAPSPTTYARPVTTSTTNWDRDQTDTGNRGSYSSSSQI